jgi:glycosyltransferase involved in cell wall biosynthesis
MPKLTLSMIVKDEESNLRDCLESVKDIADEIVIVDTGSKDRTLDIAREFDAQIHHFNWIDDFSAARNYALSKSTGDWILYLDADERLRKDSIPELKKIIATNDNAAYKCLLDCIDNHNNKPSLLKYTRLFRNNRKIKFTGRVHEQVLSSLKKLKYDIRNSDISILHVGYDIPIEELNKKAKRNLKLLLKEFNERPTIYIAFQIAQSYGVLDDEKNVIKYFDYIINERESPKLYKAHAYRYKAAKALEKNHYKKALSLAKMGETLDSEQPLLNMLLSKIYFLTGDKDNAVKYVRKAFEGNKYDDKKEFELTVNERSILYLGLQISANVKNISEFNFYYNKLKKSYEQECTENDLLNFVGALFNADIIHENKIPIYPSVFDNANYKLIFSLFDDYPHNEIKLKLLEKVPSAFKEKSDYLNTLGTTLMAVNKLAEAADSFEKSLRIDLEDPSIIFYLISIYIQLGEIESIPRLIDIAERKFCDIPEICLRVNLLKEKLAPLLNVEV